MIKTVYFHMGTVKTGSTFLQKFCHDNVDFLAANDLAYPHITPPELHLPRYTNASFLWQKETWDDARSVFDGLPQSRLLISEEGLMGTPSKINLPLFDQYRKRAVIYIRPPADLIAAWAAEKCKPYNAAVSLIPDKVGILSVEHAMMLMLGDYTICMDRLMSELSTLDDEDVIIRPYEIPQFRGGSLATDFFDAFDIRVPVFDSTPINTSPTRKYCDISYMVWCITQRLQVPEYFDYMLMRDIYGVCRSGDDRPILETLPDSTIERICARLQYIEEYFSCRYFNGRPLFERRYPNMLGKPRPAYTPPDYYEVENVTRAAINNRLNTSNYRVF